MFLLLLLFWWSNTHTYIYIKTPGSCYGIYKPLNLNFSLVGGKWSLKTAELWTIQWHCGSLTCLSATSIQKNVPHTHTHTPIDSHACAKQTWAIFKSVKKQIRLLIFLGEFEIKAANQSTNQYSVDLAILIVVVRMLLLFIVGEKLSRSTNHLMLFFWGKTHTHTNEIFTFQYSA